LLKVVIICQYTQTVRLQEGSSGALAGTGPGAQRPPATGFPGGPAKATGCIQETRVGGWTQRALTR